MLWTDSEWEEVKHVVRTQVRENKLRAAKEARKAMLEAAIELLLARFGNGDEHLRAHFYAAQSTAAKAARIAVAANLKATLLASPLASGRPSLAVAGNVLCCADNEHTPIATIMRWAMRPGSSYKAVNQG